MSEQARYGIAELAELGGVTRRTVRYYIQEGLLPTPLGVGRGKHYSHEHLERLLELKGLQERGHTLGQIRQVINKLKRKPTLEVAAALEIPRSPWSRIELLPGLEIHVSGRYRLPPPGRLNELAQRCRQIFRDESEDRDE